ncbi:uncharacterized protein EV154DRAFT_484579 [Mucor mucedo]|uniref:uncharacterized protein n=1 Tax=Mucor mucedo TaxID=29922 RepID=UPI00222070EB|nr:uncharacterized protein EV154DRAFT_484579 [Mucor mucedo]KAI7887935.1 hypothetical protein EV154DRAFT_484579 [Mucor mucedo]
MTVYFTLYPASNNAKYILYYMMYPQNTRNIFYRILHARSIPKTVLPGYCEGYAVYAANITADAQKLALTQLPQVVLGITIIWWKGTILTYILGKPQNVGKNLFSFYKFSPKEFWSVVRQDPILLVLWSVIRQDPIPLGIPVRCPSGSDTCRYSGPLSVTIL